MPVLCPGVRACRQTSPRHFCLCVVLLEVCLCVCMCGSGLVNRTVALPAMSKHTSLGYQEHVSAGVLNIQYESK